MTSLLRRLARLLLVFAALCSAPQALAQPAPAQPTSELDVFMQKVLARRDVNRQTLKQYILDEAEEFEVLGPGRWPLYRTKREFTWYLREGNHVRSPVKFDGVSVGEEARDRYERNWLGRERARQEERAKQQKEKEPEVISPGIPAEPRFVSEAYFMDFKFEAGNYYLAGREKLEGQEVLKIEYYPTRMFGDDNDGDKQKSERTDDERDRGNAREKRQERRTRAQEKEFEQNIERRMNKTALITLWIDPTEHQIVKYTFDNVWLDFLPGAWLVRVDDMRASMTMGQPFPGIWLPRGMNIHAAVTLANGSFEAGYSRAFSEYREADVKSRIRVPKGARHDGFFPPVGSRLVLPTRIFHAKALQGSSQGLFTPRFFAGRFVTGGPQTAADTIREIRVHGNAYLSDDDVIRLAGVAVGKAIDDAELEAIRKRLKDSGRFETVEVRKRYRSLTDTTDVALVLLVHERPGVHSVHDGISAVLNPVRRLKSRLMFLPIITYADGYGFTYGGRMSTVDLLGIGERLSVPLTWGGVRRAALEFERPFKRGPLTRIESSFAIWNRENPRFDVRDQRVELKGRAERVFADILRVGVESSRATITFADLGDRLTTFGSNVAVDTRGDPAYPGNAVLLSAGWTTLNFRSLAVNVNRYNAEARGYLRLYRQAVFAARAQYVSADATLPPYERLLLGGSSTVRGFRTGSFDGDRSLVTSAEFRVPITSVLSNAKLGLSAFVDAGQIWDFGQSREDVAWRRGVGGGVFLIAPLARINLDVARALKTGDTRLHLSSGFTF